MAYSSFIANTYFVGEIAVPNAANETALTQAIAQYEKEILISLLGYKLYSLLIADCTGVGGVPVTQKYLDLVNGKEFTHTYYGDTYTLKWDGLTNATTKISLIAYYVWYNYVKRDITRLYSTGISMATPAAGGGWERANPTYKLADVYERMRVLYGKIPPEYKPVYVRPVIGSNLPCTFNIDPSACNFLYANLTDYPDWVFTPLWNMNAFGI